MSTDTCNPRGPLRFLILALACVAFFANYYCQDIPGVLRNQFLDKLSKASAGNPEYLFGLFYTVYALPNIILPFLAGILVDRLGYRIMNIVFCALVMLGQAFFYLGSAVNSASWMIFGRFVYGLGGEALSVTIGMLLVSWFKGNELSFSQGFNLSFARVGSVLNCLISPVFAKSSIEAPIEFATGIAAISTLGAILICIIDRYYEKRHPESEVVRTKESDQEALESFDTIRKFSKSFWIMAGLVCTLYLTVIPFNMIASGFFEDSWLKTSISDASERNQKAGQLMSIIMIVSSASFPVVGYYIDQHGQRIRLLVAASVMTIIAHLLFLDVYPMLPLIILGLGYGIFGGVIWPTVVFLVPKDKLGTAYGLMQSMQNLVLGVCPILIALLKAGSESYTNVILLFAVFGMISLYLCYLLILEDRRHKTSLNSNDQHALNSYDRGTEEFCYRSSFGGSSKIPEYDSTKDEDHELFSMLN